MSNVLRKLFTIRLRTRKLILENNLQCPQIVCLKQRGMFKQNIISSTINCFVNPDRKRKTDITVWLYRGVWKKQEGEEFFQNEGSTLCNKSRTLAVYRIFSCLSVLNKKLLFYCSLCTLWIRLIRIYKDFWHTAYCSRNFWKIKNWGLQYLYG